MTQHLARLFMLVLARDGLHVDSKIQELKSLDVPYMIVCGSRLNRPNMVYREPRGKYDAINFGAKLVPKDTDVVVLNDVDTQVHNFGAALKYFNSEDVAVVFARVSVKEGPQKFFYRILDAIRRRVPIAASGELMLVRQKVLDSILPIKPCKAEDSYIMFKAMELKKRVVFCEESCAETERTKTAENEEQYKRRTVCGIYQALSQIKSFNLAKLFYAVLPVACPSLLVFGKKGYFWMRGILLGLSDYLRGDHSGYWQQT